MNRMNQKQRILKFLSEGRKLTRLNSWERLGILEAPARISELKKEGHEIKKRNRKVVNSYGEERTIAEWYM